VLTVTSDAVLTHGAEDALNSLASGLDVALHFRICPSQATLGDTPSQTHGNGQTGRSRGAHASS
jgi:hypothetical protein